MIGWIVVFMAAFMSGPAYAVEEEGGDYGHISYVDKEARIIRVDNTEENAVINLPVVAGDTVVTNGNGRCELQFDNGTIIRLDKNTRLKVITILAPSLTSRWAITTLHLLQGRIYTMVQSYNREMFQIITPIAAMDMKHRSAANIQARENGETYVHVDKGKFDIMFGGDLVTLRTERLRSGKDYIVTTSNRMKFTNDERNVDFAGWNKYVNRNFMDLHRGVSNVPKKLYRSNKALVYWAEKFSTVYGEWIYDDLFGYVWKPADELFALSKRPFFNAGIIEVNGQLIVVPTQPWGWIPAHMGTWVWTKWGWTWVPGTAFHSGIASVASWLMYPTLDYWMRYFYGGYDYYYYYRENGYKSWRNKYGALIGVKLPQKPHLKLKTAPKTIREIFKHLDKTPVRAIKERLGTNRPTPTFDAERIKQIMKSRIAPGKAITTGAGSGNIAPAAPALAAKAQPSKTIVNNALVSELFTLEKDPIVKKLNGNKGAGKGNAGAGGGGSLNLKFRDWNPDIHWGIYKGLKVQYSSKDNEMVCPKLQLSSRHMTNIQRIRLAGGRRNMSSRGFMAGSSGSGSSGSYTSGSSGSVHSASASASSRGGGSGDAGSRGSSSGNEK